MTSSTPRELLEDCFAAALVRVEGEACVREALARGVAEPLQDSRLWLLAAGKAACSMARAAEDWAGGRLEGGLAITADGHATDLRSTRVLEGAHPVPDQRTGANAREVLAFLAAIPSEDALLVLLSGGTSALLSLPVSGIEEGDFARVTQQLLEAGADIEELNAVRKHLSATGGGRLAEATRCREISVLVLSDVMGDRLDVIGSAPFAPDPSRIEDALEVLERIDLLGVAPASVVEHLKRGRGTLSAETPKPGAAIFEHVRHEIVASNADAREAAVQHAKARGFRSRDIGEVLRGEARTAGEQLASLVTGLSPPAPTVLVAGGETAVVVTGRGRGGRSQELALSAALYLDSHAGVAVLAAGTDGRDGPTDAAGAFADSETLERANALGLDARAYLDDNDSHSFFVREGGVLRTGPTQTNVMDLALIAITPPASRA